MQEYNHFSATLKVANSRLRTELLVRRIRGLVIIEDEGTKANKAYTPRSMIEDCLTQLNQSHETFRCDDDVAMRNIPKTLGIERDDVIFDAVKGFDLNAFAALAGSLKAGSICWLIVPNVEQWRNTPDHTSLRWNNLTYSTSIHRELSNTELTNSPSKQDSSQSIIPFNFITHFYACLMTSEQTYRIALSHNVVARNVTRDNLVTNHVVTSHQAELSSPFFIKLLDDYYLNLQQSFLKTESHNPESQNKVALLSQRDFDNSQDLSNCKKINDKQNVLIATSKEANLNAIAKNEPTDSQRKILEACLNSQHHLHLLLAKRGRGKSWLVAELIKQFIALKISYTLTAPNKRATKLAIAAQDQFIAPEDLTRLCNINVKNRVYPISQWLIVDEAAMLPIAWLKLWHKHFSRVLLVSTTQGYEGSGQGLRMKLLDANLSLELFKLEAPIRYAHGDPLEAFVEQICAVPSSGFLQTQDVLQTQDSQLSKYKTLHQNHLLRISSLENTSPKSLPEILALYQLLYSAHYQTTPTDLRRILDAQHQQLIFLALDTAQSSQESSTLISDKNHQKNWNEQLIAGCWVLEEGGADILLAKAIWAGKRRPKGNLVAQSLTAHAGMPQAAVLKSWRITRIAVDQTYRRYGFASKLIDYLKSKAKRQNIDFLSVSFGYEAILFAFWQTNGFVFQHISFSKDISSGTLSCMMILPLSQVAKELAELGYQRLALYCGYPDYFQLKLEHERFLLIKQLVTRQPVTKTSAKKTLVQKQITDDLCRQQTHFIITDDSSTDDLAAMEFTTHELHLLYGFAKQHRPIDTVLPVLSKLNLHAKKMFSNKKISRLNHSLDKLSALYGDQVDKKIIHNKQLIIQEIKHYVSEWLTDSHPEAIIKFDNWLISDKLNTLYFK